MKTLKQTWMALALSLAVLVPAAQAQTPAAAPAIDQDAIAALTRMGTYLRSLKAYQIDVTITDEDVLDDGQKIQSESHTNLLARMPNGIRVERSSDRVERLYLWDGKNASILARRMNYYATVPAPATISELIDVLDEQYGIDMPLVDLFLWGAPEWTPAKIKGAMVVGPSVVAGTTCDQYAFRQDEVDYQIWIQKGDFPLPRRIVITTKTDEARPQHTAAYNWNLAPSFNDGAFVLDPPTGALRVELAKITVK